jgi:hypothetical protein
MIVNVLTAPALAMKLRRECPQPEVGAAWEPVSETGSRQDRLG